MSEQYLSHKILAIVEEEGAERARYALKLLQSEAELTIASTGKDLHPGIDPQAEADPHGDAPGAELKRREPAGDEDAELGVLLSSLHRGRGGELTRGGAAEGDRLLTGELAGFRPEIR